MQNAEQFFFEKVEPMTGTHNDQVLVPDSFIAAYIPEADPIDELAVANYWPDVPIGKTGFDVNSSEDMKVWIYIPDYALPCYSAGMFVSIESDSGLRYLATISGGPFVEPNGIPGDHDLIIIPNITPGGHYLPKYHGRAEATLLGHITDDLTVIPSFVRPKPLSTVKPLSDVEYQRVMGFGGSAVIGTTMGAQQVTATFDPRNTSVLPTHLAVVGTTGSGKSVSGANLLFNACIAGITVIALDKEGDLSFVDQPADDPALLALLKERGWGPFGLPDTTLYVMAGRKSRNPHHPDLRHYSLRFSDISPHALAELVGLNDAQKQRFWEAINLAWRVIKDCGLVSKSTGSLDLSLMDEGYPGMKFSHFYDVLRIALAVVSGDTAPDPRSPELLAHRGRIENMCGQGNLSNNASSWKVVIGRMGDLSRANIFDVDGAPPLDFQDMLKPGKVNIFDLSDSDELSVLNNLVISRTLRGVRNVQEIRFNEALEQGTGINPVEIIVEEVHEFLSRDTIAEMPAVYRQLRRTALRGRKRGLGLVVMSQFPDRLPDEVIGLFNNWIIHKITNSETVRRLKATVGEVPDTYWDRLHTLKRGQAIVVIPGQWEAPSIVTVPPPRFKVLKAG